MAIALVNTPHVEGAGTTFTTSGYDTSGADLIILAAVYTNGGTPPVITDSYGNTWYPLTAQNQGSALYVKLFYAYNTGSKSGPGHTFTLTAGGNMEGTVIVAPYSGSLTSEDPFDTEDTNLAAGPTNQINLDDIVPSEDNCLVVVAVTNENYSTSTDSVDGGFTIRQARAHGGPGFGGGLADLVQSTAATAGPTWSQDAGTNPNNWAGVIASFKAAADSAPLEAGTASFVSSGPLGILVSSTDASDGAPPYAYQWQRNEDGGEYEDLEDGDGVSGSDTLDLEDGSAVPGILYGYRLKFIDDESEEVLSNVVLAQIYTGGTLSGGGGSVFGPSVFA